MKKFFSLLKDKTETYMLRMPKGREALWLWLIAVMLLAAAYGIMSTFAPSFLTLDLFFIPLFFAVFFFKGYGLLVVIPALLLFYYGLSQIVGENLLYQYLASVTLELMEWVLASLVLIFAMHSYGLSKRNEKQMLHDLFMARTLQMALVPKNYDMGRVRIAGKIQQCREIGGDYYYFRPFQNNKVVFCLGDVMGKGIPASMITSIIMSFVYEWGKKTASPAEVLNNLNERLSSLWNSEASYFTTIFYAVYDEDASVLTYATGGHHEAVYLGANGHIELLRTEGGIVGAIEGLSWEEKQITLEPGDRIIVFTDGVIEARDSQGHMFTMEKAVQTIEQSRSENIQTMIDRLFAAVSQFSGGVNEDDIAVLVMEVKK
ncbi:MAG: PP2C family protein-serine/threonine phosphatase [bacterium]|nr:PP2C family protein-serine/threonine phosphatase [bacterium]